MIQKSSPLKKVFPLNCGLSLTSSRFIVWNWGLWFLEISILGTKGLSLLSCSLRLFILSVNYFSGSMFLSWLDVGDSGENVGYLIRSCFYNFELMSLFSRMLACLSVSMFDSFWAGPCMIGVGEEVGRLIRTYLWIFYSSYVSRKSFTGLSNSMFG